MLTQRKLKKIKIFEPPEGTVQTAAEGSFHATLRRSRMNNDETKYAFDTALVVSKLLTTNETKYGFYSARQERKNGGKFWYTPDGGTVWVTEVRSVPEPPRNYEDAVCMGEVTKFVPPETPAEAEDYDKKMSAAIISVYKMVKDTDTSGNPKKAEVDKHKMFAVMRSVRDML